jgi:hypothetical protein
MDTDGQLVSELGAGWTSAMRRCANASMIATWNSPNSDHVDSFSCVEHRVLVRKRGDLLRIPSRRVGMNRAAMAFVVCGFVSNRNT